MILSKYRKIILPTLPAKESPISINVKISSNHTPLYTAYISLSSSTNMLYLLVIAPQNVICILASQVFQHHFEIYPIDYLSIQMFLCFKV